MTIMPRIVTMSSIEIAELVEKRHDNVVRDIRNMLETLEKGSALRFEETSKVLQPNGGFRNVTIFRLPKRETLILVSGYDVRLRAKIIDRLEELELALHRRSFDGIDDDGPLAEMALKLRMVNIAHKIHGPAAGRHLWSTLGLPPVPAGKRHRTNEEWILGLIRRFEPISRRDLYRKCDHRLCGDDLDQITEALIEQGAVKRGYPRAGRTGRPTVVYFT